MRPLRSLLSAVGLWAGDAVEPAPSTLEPKSNPILDGIPDAYKSLESVTSVDDLEGLCATINEFPDLDGIPAWYTQLAEVIAQSELRGEQVKGYATEAHGLFKRAQEKAREVFKSYKGGLVRDLVEYYISIKMGHYFRDWSEDTRYTAIRKDLPGWENHDAVSGGPNLVPNDRLTPPEREARDRFSPHYDRLTTVGDVVEVNLSWCVDRFEEVSKTGSFYKQ